MPSKSFAANSAWLSLQALAHNLPSWTTRAGGLADIPRQTIKTQRRRLPDRQRPAHPPRPRTPPAVTRPLAARFAAAPAA